jgi:diguanylate cyclase (GGDEF)-like protein
LDVSPVGCVAVLDVTGMHSVNDVHGRTVGDRLLHAVEAALVKHLRRATVARLAGDQFVIVMPGVTNQRVGQDVRRAVERAWVLGRWGRPVRTSARVGAAVWSDEVGRRTVLAEAGARLRSSSRA